MISVGKSEWDKVIKKKKKGSYKAPTNATVRTPYCLSIYIVSLGRILQRLPVAVLAVTATTGPVWDDVGGDWQARFSGDGPPAHLLPSNFPPFTSLTCPKRCKSARRDLPGASDNWQIPLQSTQASAISEWQSTKLMTPVTGDRDTAEYILWKYSPNASRRR